MIALGPDGQQVVRSHAKIAAILRSRLGVEAERLLAIPAFAEGSSAIAWQVHKGQDLQRVSALAGEQQAALTQRRDELLAQVEGLAARMDGEGDAGKLAAYLLRCAVTVPQGHDGLYAAGDQPVLVNWGHAVPDQALPVPPQARTASDSRGAAPISHAAMLATPLAADHHQTTQGRRWLWWLLPLMLVGVLAWLLWLLMQPVPPQIVERELPPEPLEDPLPEARARLDALRAALAEAEQLQDDLAGVCRAVPEPEPERVPEPEPEPAPEIVKVIPKPVVKQPPEPRPEPEIFVPKPRPALKLPSEVPQVSSLPPKVIELPATPVPQPTLCAPGWSPTQRPEVMVAIDGSGSMRESFPGASSRIDAAKTAVGAVVQNLHQDIKTGLVSFTDCDETSTPKKYGYSERPALLTRVRGISPTRGTSLANSIRRAGNAAKSVGPATVVVVSDGADTCGGDPCAAARALKAKKPLLKINVIDLSGARSGVLQCVANATGGRVFTPKNAQQMAEEVQEATGQPDASRCNP